MYLQGVVLPCALHAALHLQEARDVVGVITGVDCDVARPVDRQMVLTCRILCAWMPEIRKSPSGFSAVDTRAVAMYPLQALENVSLA